VRPPARRAYLSALGLRRASRCIRLGKFQKSWRSLTVPRVFCPRSMPPPWRDGRFFGVFQNQFATPSRSPAGSSALCTSQRDEVRVPGGTPQHQPPACYASRVFPSKNSENENDDIPRPENMPHEHPWPVRDQNSVPPIALQFGALNCSTAQRKTVRAPPEMTIGYFCSRFCPNGTDGHDVPVQQREV